MITIHPQQRVMKKIDRVRVVYGPVVGAAAGSIADKRTNVGSLSG
jgi:hypothetical protein